MNMSLTGGSPHHPVSASFAGSLVADVSYAHFSVIDTPGRERRINSTTGKSSPAVGRTVSPGRHHSLQRGKNAALFATGFSVARRATGFLASIRAGRRVGVENAVGSSAVGIYTAGRAQRQREPFSLSVEGDDLLFTLQLETPHEG